MDKEIFVQNVKKLCFEKNIRPTNVCKESGVGGSFLSDIARGQTPSVAKVQMLAQYLGVTTSELLGEEEKPTPTYGDGLSEEMLEVIRRYKAAPPALRAAALAVLRAAEEQSKAQGDSTTGQ